MLRAAFTLELPAKAGKSYPSNADVIDYLRTFGWEISLTQASEYSLPERLEHYKKQASKIISKMPEATAGELEYIIFFGYQHDNQVPFLVSRMTPSQITFRLISNDLAIIQTSVERLAKKITSSKILGKKINISGEISIFQPVDWFDANANSDTRNKSKNTIDSLSEPYRAKAIIFGRSIPSVFTETRHRAKKDLAVAGLALIMLIILVAIVITKLNLNFSWINNILQELFIVSITTLIVSIIGIIQTYLETYIDVRRDNIIVWENIDRVRLG